MPQIRVAPSGPPIVGNNISDMLVWTGTEWEAQAGSVGTPHSFDFILTSRAELAAVVAPVGGVFTLPNGSYAIRTGFALNAGERLEVPIGGNVLIMCMGPSKAIVGAPTTAPLLTVLANASALLIGLNLVVTGDGNAGLETQGNTTMVGGNVQVSGNGTEALHVIAGTLKASNVRFAAGANSNVADQSAGEAIFTGCTFENGQSFAYDQTGGTLRATQCIFSGGASGYRMTGAGEQDGYLTSCDISAGGTSPGVTHSGTNGDLFMTDCLVVPTGNGAPCVSIGPASSLNIRGGELRSAAGTPGDGVSVNGNIAGGLQVIGVTGDSLDDFVAWSSGTVNRAMVANCDTASTVSTGVDWAAANIPTNGLIEWGNQFNTTSGNAYQNHTAATARVNRKGNTHNAGLSQETAIVP
jgi:hypothetical protein